jgi:transcriptional regulator with XRE-family HTH domain
MLVMTDTVPRIGRVPRDVDGARIRRLRIDQGLTAAGLAKQARRVSWQHICDIERGYRRPSAQVLHRIAKALGTTAPALLVQSERAEPARA